MVLLEAGKLPRRRLLDIWDIPDLRGIQVHESAVTIGALSTYTDLLSHAVINDEFPLICDAARETGAIAIQNRGTVGSNIANASPAADLPPALLVYDAELELVSARGRRRIPYDRFHTGYKTMDMAAEEIIAGVALPRTPRPSKASYRKVGTRRAQAISKICFAARLRADPVVREIRIALGSVAPTVIRARAAEEALLGRVADRAAIDAARAALARDMAPIDDIRSTARYRLGVAGNLLEDFLS